MSAEEPDPDVHAAVRFHEVYWRDAEAGRVRPLSEYLRLFPGHESTVVREYLVVEGARERPPAPQAAPESLPGHVGPYRLLREIGRGGQGVVYLAEDVRLGRDVALKVIESTVDDGATSALRFHREAAVASRLDHPGICAVFDAGRIGGVSYIAMRHVPGVSLAARLADARAAGARGLEGSWLPPFIAKAARALHAAHEAGIVHRDVKPGNLMVTPDGDPVILDFGIARDDASGVTLTETGDLFGTPAYVAPEQLGAKKADRRADVYALGVVLYECLTLTRPFEAPTRAALYERILRGGPEDPRARNPAISRDLAGCVLTAIERDPDRRYQTAAAFADDLEAIVAGRPIAARPPGALGRAWRWARRRPASAAVVALLIVGVPIVAALATYAILTRDAVLEGERAERARQVEALLEEGFFELGDGSADVARAAFERALALDPRSVEAVAGCALALLRQDQPGAAVTLLEAHAGLRDSSIGLLTLAADAAQASGRVAARAPESRAEAARDALECFLAGSRHMARGHRGEWREFPAALREFEMAILRSPRARALYYLEAAHAATHVEDPEAIARLVSALEQLWPSSPRSRFYSAVGRIVAGDPAGALPHLEDLVREHPAMIDARRALGYCLLALGRPAESAAAFRVVLAAQPDSSAARRGLGRALLADGDAQGAVVELRAAARIVPRDPHVRANLAEALAAAGDLDGAVGEWNESLRLGPDRPWEIRHRLGSELIRGGRVVEGIVELRASVAVDPTYHAGWMRLGIALSQAGNEDDARRAFESCLRLKPGDLDALRNVAVTYRRQRRYEEALEAAREVVRLDDSRADSHFLLGLIQDDRGDVAGAIDAYAATTRKSPSHAEAWCHLGLRTWKQGRFADALPFLRKGHELGTARPSWTDPSARWIETCSRLAAKDAALRAVMKGESRPAAPRDWVHLADFCRESKTAVDEALLLARAMEDENLTLQAALRPRAARAAARAARSSAEGGWARRALTLMAEHLDWMQANVDAGERTVDESRRIARGWLEHADFAPLRGQLPDPADEALRQKTWDRIRALAGR
jgi:tetratricopeptide (TPR) repeat protein